MNNESVLDKKLGIISKVFDIQKYRAGSLLFLQIFWDSKICLKSPFHESFL